MAELAVHLILAGVMLVAEGDRLACGIGRQAGCGRGFGLGLILRGDQDRGRGSEQDAGRGGEGRTSPASTSAHVRHQIWEETVERSPNVRAKTNRRIIRWGGASNQVSLMGFMSFMQMALSS